MEPKSADRCTYVKSLLKSVRMIAFLPLDLEEKMSRLEMARARERGVSREEDIRQTVFECVRRGGGFDVIVIDQTLFGG